MNDHLIDPNRKEKKEEVIKLGLKAIFGIIVVVVSIVYGICKFHYDAIIQTKDAVIEQKDATIETFQQNSNLEKIPSSVEELSLQVDLINKNLQPIFAAINFDQFNGTLNLNGMVGSTKATFIFNEAINDINNKDYDGALIKAEDLNKLIPGFIGSEFIKFLIHRDKKQREEAFQTALTITESLPNDNRNEMKILYAFLIIDYKQKNNRMDLEKILKKTIKLWPDDNTYIELFKQEFGFIPKT